MNPTLPTWAFRAATPQDQMLAQTAQRHGHMQITWPNADALRRWAKQHGWPTPWWDFEATFIAHMLKSQENFALALATSGIQLQIPREAYTLSAAMLRTLDALYESRATNGRPTEWGSLVEELREIRRAVEAGVVVQIEGAPPLLDWQSFYQWAHGRYHMLEDGYDAWIGDDA